MPNGHTRNKRARGNARPRHTLAAPPRPPGTAADARNGSPARRSGSPLNAADIGPSVGFNGANGASPHKREQPTRPKDPRARNGALGPSDGVTKPPMAQSSATLGAAPPWVQGPEVGAPDTPAAGANGRAPRAPRRDQVWRSQPPRRAGEEPRVTPMPAAGPSTPPPTVENMAPEVAADLPTGRPPLPEEHAELVIPERLPRTSGPIVVPAGHAPFRPEVRGELGPLIDELKERFTQDRVIASQGTSARCGICYLYHTLGELEYREAEGFYVCLDCKQALGNVTLPMVRRQQR